MRETTTIFAILILTLQLNSKSLNPHHAGIDPHKSNAVHTSYHEESHFQDTMSIDSMRLQHSNVTSLQFHLILRVGSIGTGIVQY